MSYLTTVLARAPFFFGYLNEITASVITDSSGNGYDGTYFSEAVKGLGSPIETDASSYAVGSRVGLVPDAPAPTEAFSWGGWVFHEPGSSAIASGMVCRNGQIGLPGSNMAWIEHSGAIAARINIDANPLVFYDLSYSLGSSGGWYRVLVSRNAGVMRLYVNGILRDQRMDLAIGAMTNAAYLSGGGSGWKLGVTGDSGNVWSGVRTGPIDLYDYALTAADEIAIYESALATLPLRATIVINIGVDLNTDQVTPVDLPFAHNFSKTFGSGEVPITEELEYRTNLNRSEPDYEQRVNARPHGALRTLEYHVSPTAGGARSRFHGALFTPGQYYCTPVWTDAGVTTGSAASGTNTIPCDTTLRDYEELSYVGVCTDTKSPDSFQFFQIASGGVADDELTLASNISTTIPSGSIVFPARVASISEDSLSIHSFASDHEDAVIRFEVIESELSTRRITEYSAATTYKGFEVFDLEAAKVQFLDDRPYELSRRIQARGRDYQYGLDTGSPQTFPVRFLLTSRSALSEFLGWLDQRQGKQNPLWISSRENDLTITAKISSSEFIVSPKTGFSFHDARRDIEFLLTDGTYLRARVTGITDNGTSETWTFTGITPPFSSIARASFLKYCRLATDTIRVSHFKGGIAECTLSFQELLTSPN